MSGNSSRVPTATSKTRSVPSRCSTSDWRREREQKDEGNKKGEEERTKEREERKDNRRKEKKGRGREVQTDTCTLEMFSRSVLSIVMLMTRVGSGS